jgi:hypothetical protein
VTPTELLYWTSRIALAIGWTGLAIVLWRHHRRGAALLALSFGSLRAYPYNYLLLDAARALLRTFGWYDERMPVKWLLAAVLATLAALLLWREVRRVRAGANSMPVLLLGGLGAQAVLLAIETCSFDDALPRPLVQQPGRYLYEGAALALACTGWWRGTHR